MTSYLHTSQPVFLTHAATVAAAVGAARVAIAWAVLQKFGTSALGVVIIVLSVGQFLGAFFAGALTDRFRRKGILALTSLVIAGAMGFISIVVDRSASHVAVACLAFLGYFCLAVHDNAARTLIPSIVSHAEIRGLNGRFLGVTQVLQFVAPAVAGWVIDSAGAKSVFLASAALCVVGAVTAAMIRVVSAAAPASQAPAVSQDNARTFILASPWLILGLVLVTAANAFIVPIASYLVPLRVEEGNGTASQLGFFFSALSAGVAMAGFSGLTQNKRFTDVTQLSAFIGGAACVYVLIAIRADIFTLVVLGFLIGGLLCLFEANWNSTIQEQTPSHILGRVYATSSWMSFGARSIGTAGATWLVSRLPVATVMIICACAMLVAIAAISGGRYALSRSRHDLPAQDPS
jgi:MFS family permease